MSVRVNVALETFNSMPLSSDFGFLLITFTNSKDHFQNFGPDLDPNL